MPPEFVARFRAALDELGVTMDAPLLVAVSGGADSLALLLLAQALLGEACVAATVDHGLRPAAADEARHVATLCAARGIGHAILTAPLPDRAGGTANVSARARALRYRLLEEHADAIGAPLIATAHHADDQVETVVMRLNRGAGVGGLAGIRARGERVVRPLLGFRRHELADLAERCGVTPIADPSNVDDRFDRARLRKHLARVDWLDPHAIVASARALDEADRAIAWLVRHVEPTAIARNGQAVTLRPLDLPAEVLRRLVLRCLAIVDPGLDPTGGEGARMVAALRAGEVRTLGGVVARPGRGEAGDPVWRFAPAPPRRTG